MNHLQRYLIEVNTFPKFKRRNKWADKFLVRCAGAFFLLMLGKIFVEWIYETLLKM